MMFFSFLIPFLIWLIVPNKDHIEVESNTPINDIFEIIFNALFVVIITLLINKSAHNSIKKLYLVCILPVKLTYYVCWILAYFSIYNEGSMWVVTIIPCLVFILYSLTKRNLPALMCAVGFSVCHIIFAALNVVII